MTFDSLEHMLASTFEGIISPENLTVAEAAKKYVYIREKGSYVGYWSETIAPYMVEPQDVLTSLDYIGMVFISGARTGKSQTFLNWLSHTAKTDPTNMMLVHLTQTTARTWSNGDLEKLFRNSPEIKKLLSPGRNNDNTFDKTFMSGMRLEITWPKATNLSGKTSRYNWWMDYDRSADDIDGEGNGYDLLAKRAESFKRFGMTVAESSPNPDKEMLDPKWSPSTPHEAPPIRGIFELYNRGDRRRWNWRCPQCHESFEPSFKLFDYPKSDDLMESAEQVTLVCPHDGFPMTPDMKRELNLGGKWIKEGQIWLPNGDVAVREGQKIARSNIASFWMKGPAAAFQDWSNLVLAYLRANDAYDKTGDESPLRKTITADQGDYYISKARLSDRLPETLKDRAEDWGGTANEPVVPASVRFLVSTIDVQARSFVVQTHGIGPGGDIYLVDMFKIRKSKRLDEDGDPMPIDPAAYPEDWLTIVDEVMLKTYPLGDGSGRRMMVKMTACDSGGQEGVTPNAYNFSRYLRTESADLYKRFLLVKGEHSKSAPRIRLGYPDAQRKDRNSGARGDVPVLFINSTTLKDMVASMLGRGDTADGAPLKMVGMVHFPHWAEDWMYRQLTTEIRTDKGWENPHGGVKRRNEAFDLLYYCMAICLHTSIRIEHIDWENPPTWASDWDTNDLVFGGDENLPFSTKPKRVRDLSKLAEQLA